MKLYCLFALAALGFAASTTYAADADFERNYTVSGPATVNVKTGSGYIHLYSGSGNQVHVHGHVRVLRPFGDSDRIVSGIVAAPPVRQSGNTVTAEPVPPSNGGLFSNISIDYDITAPPNSTVEAKTGSGSMEVGGIQGEVTAETGSGSIHVDNIGPKAHLSTGSGSIRGTKLHGGASLQTGSGNIEAAVDAAGDVTAHTGSGHIQLDGLNGGARVTTGSGSIAVSGAPAEEWRVETGSGSVHLNLIGNAHCNVDLHTGSGGIQVNKPVVMQGAMNKHHVTGSIGGGGATIRASTGSGSITIE